MKYKLPRPVVSPTIHEILQREMRKQRLTFHPLSSKEVKGLQEIVRIIEKKGLPPYLACENLPHHLGKGIFLKPDARPLPKGHVIGSYAGETSLIRQTLPDDGSYAFTPVLDLHLTREEQQIFDHETIYRPQRLYAYKIDAIKSGNFTRYINHSEKPNVIAELVSIPNNRSGLTPALVEVVYFCKKVIHPGEQLLISYEAGEKCYWNSKVKPFAMTPTTFQL